MITWAQPAPIVTGTPLGPDQLNATASVPGCLTYTPVAGTVLDPGGYSLVVEFVPDDLVHYQPISLGVALEVKKFPFILSAALIEPGPFEVGEVERSTRQLAGLVPA